MDSEIKITAKIEAYSPEVCKFTVDRPVYPDGSASFESKDKAAGSPLAERLFALPEVAAVRIAKDVVTVTKKGSEEWRPVAVKVAAAIRDHVKSGKPAVSDSFKASLLPDAELKVKVQEIFDTQINPAVASHGGFVDLIDVKDNRVYLKLGGGCQGCGMADVTLRQGIEATLRNLLPQLDEVLDVTDHASGSNPYYSPAKK